MIVPCRSASIPTTTQRIKHCSNIRPSMVSLLKHMAALRGWLVNGPDVQADSLSHSPITKYPGGPVDAPVNAAAKRRGATPNQIIMAWVRAKGAVIVTYVVYSMHYSPQKHHISFLEQVLRKIASVNILPSLISVRLLCFFPISKLFILLAQDPLTESEIVAIDKAGAKGPPKSTSIEAMVRRVTLSILTFAFYEFFQFAIRKFV